MSDGDTFTGLDSRNRQVQVRLHGIDAPEKAQAFGDVARKALWADAHPVPPWEWRRSEKERKAAKKGAGVGR